jgi:hypothetical protein
MANEGQPFQLRISCNFGTVLQEVPPLSGAPFECLSRAAAQGLP